MAEGAPEARSDARAYAHILWKRKAIVLVTVAVFVVGCLVVDLFRTKEYSATSSVLFVSQSYSGTTPLELSPQDIATQIRIVQSAPVRALAKAKLGSDPPPASVAQDATTATANITVTSRSPHLAARAANAYAAAYISYSQVRFRVQEQMISQAIQRQISALQGQIDAIEARILVSKPAIVALLTGQLGTVSGQQEALRTQLIAVLADAAQSPSGGVLIQPATVPTHPSSPRILVDLLIAAVIGLLVGVALALAWELRSERGAPSG